MIVGGAYTIWNIFATYKDAKEGMKEFLNDVTAATRQIIKKIRQIVQNAEKRGKE